MNTQFNPNKPYQCRDGCKAKIVETELTDNYPILYIRTDELGNKSYNSALPSGHISISNENNPQDLINIPEKKMLDIWVNVYPEYESINASKETADLFSSARRTACLHIQREYVEGEGL